MNTIRPGVIDEDRSATRNAGHVFASSRRGEYLICLSVISNPLRYPVEAVIHPYSNEAEGSALWLFIHAFPFLEFTPAHPMNMVELGKSCSGEFSNCL